MNRLFSFLLAVSCFLPTGFLVQAQEDSYFAPGNRNPVLPGFFADPSLVELDGRYYIYATTVSKYMEPMVWVSDDLVDWQVKSLGITGEHLFWAPAMIKGEDGKYYLYHTSGFDFKCHLYIGESPTGPFEKFGLVDEGFDLQIFRDPSTGMVYGCSSDPNARPRLVEFESDPQKEGYMTKVIKETSLQGSFFDYTEGSFLLYRDGWYYLMYSGGKCDAEIYKVNYARSKNIWGPYEEAPNNPILASDADKKIFGPGHNSVFHIEDEYFIVYHREDFYHYPTCSERQVCIDRMDFDGEGWISKVTPTNKGVDFAKIITGKSNNLVNIAKGKKVACGGVSGSFNPEFAVDDNFATRWIGRGYLSVDLGREYEIEKIVPQFVYYDYFNLYRILYSNDNVSWKVYADRSKTAVKAWESVPAKQIKARYVKIQFVRGEGNPATMAELQVFAVKPE
ncbi:MAG TPA: family 43 glycosylhydrolase [Bacteroidales bacterium]|nr:family 43 glycosylhydrolase [Bacteroidales bacterium]